VIFTADKLRAATYNFAVTVTIPGYPYSTLPTAS
jgi:hypothetical protein